LITTFNVPFVAQPPEAVNICVDVPAIVVLIVAGFQVPLIPLRDVEGITGAVEFWHKGPIGVKFGTTELLTAISIVVAIAQPPEGVNV
jgi:hypothetical protein